MFLNDLKAYAEPDNVVGLHISYQNIDLLFFTTSGNDRSNWLKKIAIAQKHIKDTESSIMQRRRSSKLNKLKRENA